MGTLEELLQGFLSRERILGVAEALAKAVLVLVIARLAIKATFPLVDKMLRERGEDAADRRVLTARTLLKSVLRYAIDFIALLSILDILNVPTRSILAGAGLVGLAVGFGAQQLVRDVISGFFVIFEDQFAVGEYITAGGVSGIVEEIDLRVTKIRDFSGDLHIVPNGSLGTVTNHCRGNMRVLIDVSVAYEEDLDRVLEVLEKECEAMATEIPDIREGPRVLGVSKLGDSAVSFRILARTAPMAQWAVERQMLKRLKQALDREGIEIPYPRYVVVPARLTKAGRDDQGGPAR